ncbi:hypothetical protein LIER_14322 [Lithospermum erythrorhizon]|uniref:Uncharacterized protein n=1 Tax=Lithospermum erythrorhizon TaxID=34254 RepID=A0AAV3Q0Q9_LITER
MGKKSRKAKGKTTFIPLPMNDFFKDLETPPVHGLNPMASAVFHELEKALPSTSRVFDDSPLSTPRAGLGKLVEGDVSDGLAKGFDVPCVDYSTPVVDGGCCGGYKAYGHNFFGYELLSPPIVDVGLEPTVALEDDQDVREDVCKELEHEDVVELPRVEERVVREGFSYSEAFFSNLDPVGDSEDDISHEAEDSEEELELDDAVGVSGEELEQDEFIEVWVSFLDIPLEYTHMPLI